MLGDWYVAKTEMFIEESLILELLSLQYPIENILAPNDANIGIYTSFDGCSRDI